MIVKPNITNEEFFKEKVTSSNKKTMYNVKFGPIQKPIFKMSNCVVKYPTGSYDKLVVEHEYGDFINELNKIVFESLGSDSEKYVPFKYEELGIKVGRDIKHKTESITKYDVVDVLVEFNNLWVIKGNIYPSFTLKDVRISEEKVEPKDMPFSFDDIGA